MMQDHNCVITTYVIIIIERSLTTSLRLRIIIVSFYIPLSVSLTVVWFLVKFSVCVLHLNFQSFILIDTILTDSHNNNSYTNFIIELLVLCVVFSSEVFIKFMYSSNP